MNICKHCFRLIRQIDVSDTSYPEYGLKWFHIGFLTISANVYCAMMSSKPLPHGRMADLQVAEPLFRIKVKDVYEQ